MKLTNEHYTYWLQHKCPIPRWERERNKGPYGIAPISVHGLINRQISEDRRLEAYNLLNSLKSCLRRGQSIRQYLAQFIQEWGFDERYKRRAAYARKWIKRLK